MSSIPSHLARVPNNLASKIILQALQRTQASILTNQIQLATGRRVNHASDDPLATSVVSVLDDVVERRGQWLRNLSHADAVLNNVDAALADATDLFIEAKGIASSQVGVGSDTDTRRNQAAVIDSLLIELFATANRDYQQVHFFGGSATARPPMEQLLSGYRYTGQGAGLANDLGMLNPINITLSGEDAFGALSARVTGNFDLDPTLAIDTRLVDLNGARGLGVTLGEVNIDVGGTLSTLDLSTAHTVGDVAAMLEAEIRLTDITATVVISAGGNTFEIAGAGPVTITDLTGATTAADLGLDIPGGFPGPAMGGNDIDARITDQTLVTSLPGLTQPLGTIRLSNGGQVRDLDLSTVTTVRELRNAVESLNLGIRVEIADTGDRLNFINELSGGDMSVAEVAGGLTATELGVRTFATWTRLDDLNDGRGIQIRSGSVDPITGLPDPAADIDFRIDLKDGSALDVDLAGAQTIGDVLDAITAAAAVASLPVTATLAADGNGITITDATVGTGDTSVTAQNGSFAAEDLGMVGSTGGATLTSEDRATVAVESVFTHLLRLRDALLTDDERGITLAAEKFDRDISGLAEARANVGVRSRRVATAVLREEDLRIQDMALRSQVQDLDYTEASIRFAMLQQQLQAGLITAQQVTSLSLLDFLG